MLFFVVDILKEESTLFVPNKNVKKELSKFFNLEVLELVRFQLIRVSRFIGVRKLTNK